MLSDKILSNTKDYFKTNTYRKYRNNEDENDNLYYLLCYIFFDKNFDFTTYSTDYFKRSLKSALKQLSNEEGILSHEARFVSSLIKLKNEKLFVSIFFSIIEVKVSNFLFSRLTSLSNKGQNY